MLIRETRNPENSHVKFSPSDWDGKEYFTEQLQPPGKPRVRASPAPGARRPSRRGSADVVSEDSGSARNGVPDPARPRHKPQPVFAPPPGQVKFSAEEWAKTLKDTNWVYPTTGNVSPVRNGPASAKKPEPSRSSARSKSTTRPAMGKPAYVSDVVDEADVTSFPFYSTTETRTSSGTNESSDSNAMDIDVELPTVNGDRQKTPNANEGRKAAPPTSGGTDSTRRRLSAPDVLDFKLGDLRNVAPLAPTNEGLKDLKDLAQTLPFESRPSSHHHPLKTFTPQHLQLPPPPRAPATPARLTQQAWRDYLSHMHAYMAEWNRFNTTMLAHFVARQSAADRMSGAGWLDALGETAGQQGYASYLKGLKEDERVRMHWNVSCDRHLQALERHGSLRERVLQGNVAETLA